MVLSQKKILLTQIAYDGSSLWLMLMLARKLKEKVYYCIIWKRKGKWNLFKSNKKMYYQTRFFPRYDQIATQAFKTMDKKQLALQFVAFDVIDFDFGIVICNNFVIYLCQYPFWSEWMSKSMTSWIEETI